MRLRTRLEKSSTAPVSRTSSPPSRSQRLTAAPLRACTWRSLARTLVSGLATASSSPASASSSPRSLRSQEVTGPLYLHQPGQQLNARE